MNGGRAASIRGVSLCRHLVATGHGNVLFETEDDVQLLAVRMLLVANLVTTSKALVTSSDALVSSSFLYNELV